MIATNGGSRVALAAKAATATIPIVFSPLPALATDLVVPIRPTILNPDVPALDKPRSAGGNIAAESLVRAAPEGYTLLLATSADDRNQPVHIALRNGL